MAGKLQIANTRQQTENVCQTNPMSERRATWSSLTVLAASVNRQSHLATSSSIFWPSSAPPAGGASLYQRLRATQRWVCDLPTQAAAAGPTLCVCGLWQVPTWCYSIPSDCRAVTPRKLLGSLLVRLAAPKYCLSTFSSWCYMSINIIRINIWKKTKACFRHVLRKRCPPWRENSVDVSRKGKSFLSDNISFHL